MKIYKALLIAIPSVAAISTEKSFSWFAKLFPSKRTNNLRGAIITTHTGIPASTKKSVSWFSKWFKATDNDLFKIFEMEDLNEVPDPKALKKQYKKLARKFHSDKNIGDLAADAKFQRMKSAYDILQDPLKYKIYTRLQSGPMRGKSFEVIETRVNADAESAEYINDALKKFYKLSWGKRMRAYLGVTLLALIAAIPLLLYVGVSLLKKLFKLFV